MERTEPFETDLTLWEIGPYHGSLPAPVRMLLQLDGEVIADCAIESGFLHRGLEKTFELHSWQAAIPYADHLDPEAAVFGELSLCLAVEEVGGIVVPPRAQRIRMLLAELARVSAHLAFVVRMARAVGSETIIHYVLRDRERILDLFELLTGSRFSINFLRYGGVASDITDGFIERVLEVCEVIKIRLKEYNDLFTYNQGFLKRTVNVGLLSTERARFYGITGPNARASGVAIDIRKNHPTLGYEQVDFKLTMGREGAFGDCHDRFLLRLREISQSIEILRQVSEEVPDGDFISSKIVRDYAVPVGEAYSRIESSRGLLGCHLVSDGSERPSRVQFRTPTVSVLHAIPEIVTGMRIEDLPVILASMDMSIAEADR